MASGYSSIIWTVTGAIIVYWVATRTNLIHNILNTGSLLRGEQPSSMDQQMAMAMAFQGGPFGGPFGGGGGPGGPFGGGGGPGGPFGGGGGPGGPFGGPGGPGGPFGGGGPGGPFGGGGGPGGPFGGGGPGGGRHGGGHGGGGPGGGPGGPFGGGGPGGPFGGGGGGPGGGGHGHGGGPGGGHGHGGPGGPGPGGPMGGGGHGHGGMGDVFPGQSRGRSFSDYKSNIGGPLGMMGGGGPKHPAHDGGSMGPSHGSGPAHPAHGSGPSHQHTSSSHQSAPQPLSKTKAMRMSNSNVAPQHNQAHMMMMMPMRSMVHPLSHIVPGLKTPEEMMHMQMMGMMPTREQRMMHMMMREGQIQRRMMNVMQHQQMRRMMGMGRMGGMMRMPTQQQRMMHMMMRESQIQQRMMNVMQHQAAQRMMGMGGGAGTGTTQRISYNPLGSGKEVGMMMPNQGGGNVGLNSAGCGTGSLGGGGSAYECKAGIGTLSGGQTTAESGNQTTPVNQMVGNSQHWYVASTVHIGMGGVTSGLHSIENTSAYNGSNNNETAVGITGGVDLNNGNVINRNEDHYDPSGHNPRSPGDYNEFAKSGTPLGGVSNIPELSGSNAEGKTVNLITAYDRNMDGSVHVRNYAATGGNTYLTGEYDNPTTGGSTSLGHEGRGPGGGDVINPFTMQGMMDNTYARVRANGVGSDTTVGGGVYTGMYMPSGNVITSDSQVPGGGGGGGDSGSVSSGGGGSGGGDSSGFGPSSFASAFLGETRMVKGDDKRMMMDMMYAGVMESSSGCKPDFEYSKSQSPAWNQGFYNRQCDEGSENTIEMCECMNGIYGGSHCYEDLYGQPCGTEKCYCAGYRIMGDGCPIQYLGKYCGLSKLNERPFTMLGQYDYQPHPLRDDPRYFPPRASPPRNVLMRI